ncbi:hypothetical protein LDENG_00136930 [Lucifuga dentata]|nr:hypothetical protein LDENG_00136930 [Lucifuga dentata]
MPWPRTATERLLKDTFDSSAAQFLGVLEALWDSSRRPLQTGGVDEPEQQEVVLELLSAGINILSENTNERGRHERRSFSLSSMTPTSLMDLAIAGENKISFMSAVKFIKLLFQYEQLDVFTSLSRQMLQVLSDVEGQSFRKAEMELALLDSFNSLQSSQRSRSREDATNSGSRSGFEVQPDTDLVVDVVIFLWSKVKAALWRTQPESKRHLEKLDHHHKSSSSDLFQKVCEVVEGGLEALSQGLDMLLPQDSSAIADSAFLQKFKSLPPSTSSLPSQESLEERGREDGVSEKVEEELETKAEWDMKSSGLSTRVSLAADLHLELISIRHRASLKLLQLNAELQEMESSGMFRATADKTAAKFRKDTKKVVTESQLLDQIKKNKMSKAVFLMQKALLMYNNNMEANSSKTKRLLEEASALMEKAGLEERKLYISITSTNKTPAGNKERGMKEEKENPPPPPILLSRTDHSFTFTPAPYHTDGKVCWYQLCGRTAEGANQKVRLGDFSLTGTGNLVPAESGQCVLKVEGLEPNQKYVFAVAAYSSQGKLLGNSIGEMTIPLLASVPLPLLAAWARLAQVAFQTEQYAVAKRACRELWSHYTSSKSGSTIAPLNLDPTVCRMDLWSHYTSSKSGSHGVLGGSVLTKLRVQTLQLSSPLLHRLLLTSIFIETEINVQQESLYCDSFSHSGPFIWEQEARLAECERMLVAMEMATWLNDSGAAVQAAVNCYGLLAPLIFHQVVCDPVVQVLIKCFIVLEKNSAFLKQKWNISTSESLMHMIACIAYYLSKALRVLRQHQMASEVMDRGRQLLQEFFDAQQHVNRLSSKAEGSKESSAVSKIEMKVILQLKALHRKNKKEVTREAAPTSATAISQQCELSGCEDPVIVYDHITSSPLKIAFQDVMRLRSKEYFTEFAALLLQRTMEENHPDLVIKWGKNIFEYLSRRDRGLQLNRRSSELKSQIEGRSNDQTLKGKEPLKKKKHSVSQSMKTDREMQASPLACTQQQRLQMRRIFREERAWRSQLNLSLAQAHLALLHRSLDRLHGAALQHRYSQLNPLCFSLAYSGVLVQRRNSHQQQSSDKDEEEMRVKEPITLKVREDSSQQSETHPCTAAMLLDALNRAALHFRRAMVLAHRGGHWTSLQCVCQTLWDQTCRMPDLRSAQLDAASPFTAEQLNSSLAALLPLAADLLMDMLNTTGLWSVYESDDEELESSLHFSASLDDNTKVDLRWVRTLVLYTLEQLHDRGKWERLAHLALLFNTYTRERYALIVTPLIVHAQRMLLSRIASYGGPAVPQPHHVKTQTIIGKQVTCRSYADCQLLSSWTPHDQKASPKQIKSPAQQTKPANLSRPSSTKPKSPNSDQLQEIECSMSLVCVPLDVDDTLRCYRQAREKRSYCLQIFQHSRSLLLLLLAHTQPGFAAQFRQGSRLGSVDFNPLIMSTPNLQLDNLTEEDYSSPDALYSRPLSPHHIPTVTAAFSTSIKYLLANDHDSLRVQALHEMGNLQFYNGNTQAAHSCWCKAADCALQSSGVLESWDGVSFGGGCMQQTLRRVGAAGLTAKIAQYVMTSDISQRTRCCLLSAHLFKCVLCCSLAQPQSDLQYASYSIRDELLPGVDLFSEPLRVQLGSTVSSLSFICSWLFTTGYHVTIRALTELSLFAQAVKETLQLTLGTEILPPVKTFYSNKSLLDNAQALEELVNCDFAPEVCSLYEPTLRHRFNLARVRLILALSSTIYGLPVPDSPDSEACSGKKDHSVSPTQHEQESRDAEKSSQKNKKTILLATDSLIPEKLKFILLEGASSLLSSVSQQLTSQSCSEIENLELTIETNLLKADLYLQQGRTALSSDVAASSLKLLQTSPVMVGGATPARHKPASQLSPADKDSFDALSSTSGDLPRAVEAFERMGAPLWLRCRLALLRSLTAHMPGTSIVSGKNSNEEAANMLQEALEESKAWGDPDTRALLLLEGAALEAQRRQSKDDRISLLQEAVSLLSGRTFMPPASSLTLAQASMMLSYLRGTQNTTLLKLTQKLLQQQLVIFGESVELEEGQLCVPSSGLRNIYLPQLPVLAKITTHIGHILALNAVKKPFSASTSESTPTQLSCYSSHVDGESQRPDTSALNPFQIPKVAPCPEVVQAWNEAQQVLSSALTLCQSCACRDTQLEADLLYCCGIVQRSLSYLSKVKREDVAQTFMQCIQTTMRHCHNLPMLRNCYLEVALLFFHDQQQTPHQPPAAPSQDKSSRWKRLLVSVTRGLTAAERYLLLFWIFLRGATMVQKAKSACVHLQDSTQTDGEELSKMAVESLPAFAIHDLLNPCGGVYQDSASLPLEEEDSSRGSDRKHVQLTWVRVVRYFNHLLNQQQADDTSLRPQPVEVLVSLSGDSRLALRLPQMHEFLCSHMTGYRESCCAPEPAAAEIIWLPQIVQLSSTVRTRLGQKDEIYQWSKSTKQQLCVQWHNPALSPAPGNQDTVFLLYGHNRHPISAMTGSSIGVMGLQCGLHLIKIERAKAVHAELREVCVSAGMTLSVAANLGCTSSPSSEQLNETHREPDSQHMLKLKEKIVSCCSSIKELLQPGSKSEQLTEVPFEITLENLCDLERCFNPAGGTIMDNSALTAWILSVLTDSSTSTDQNT